MCDGKREKFSFCQEKAYQMRLKMNVTQYEFAKLLDVSTSYVF